MEPAIPLPWTRALQLLAGALVGAVVVTRWSRSRAVVPIGDPGPPRLRAVLAVEVERARRFTQSVAVAAVDVDEPFVAREVDTVVEGRARRWVVLPDTDRDGALTWCRRNGLASASIAAFPDDELTIEGLVVALADQRPEPPGRAAGRTLVD